MYKFIYFLNLYVISYRSKSLRRLKRRFARSTREKQQQHEHENKNDAKTTTNLKSSEDDLV